MKLQTILDSMFCVRCNRQWLGSYYRIDECNVCRAETEPDGEDPTDEDESKVDIDDENLNHE